jgi:hypothetical protein
MYPTARTDLAASDAFESIEAARILHRLATLGYQSRPGAPEQVAPFLKADTEVIKEAGIAPQD